MPQLGAELSSVTSVTIRKGSAQPTVSLHKLAGRWTVVQRDEYPANIAKLRDLLGVNFTDTYIMDHYDLSAKDFVRSAPLKPLSPMDPSLDISELGPDGAPTATATADLKPGFLASTSSAGAKPPPEPKDGPSRVSPKDGGARKSEAAKNIHEARTNHRNRGDKK